MIEKKKEEKKRDQTTFYVNSVQAAGLQLVNSDVLDIKNL